MFALRPFTICCSLLLLATCSFAHDEPEKPQRVSDADRHVATAMPDRVILTWTASPASTQNVTWRTSTEVNLAFVEYAVATHGPYFVQNAVRISATTNSFESNLGEYHIHSAKMAALAPSTKYAYRVGDGVNWSEWFHFKTASSQPAPFQFIYFGDAQNDVRSMWSRILREAQSDAPKAAFMLHAGDLINNANSDAQWGDWFAAGDWLNAMIPCIATPGNHEYATVKKDDKEIKQLSNHWRPTFAFPENGPEGLEETAYWFDYQGTRIISLNSNEDEAKQVEWVENVLNTNANRWTIVTFHHPIYSTAQGRDNQTQRELWKPLFDKYRVDLVLQGHDHSYGRSGLDLPVNLNTGLQTRKGPTVYVVSVSGPKQYDTGQRPLFHRMAGGTQLYQIIHVDHDELRFEAHVANGELYDAFTLRKRDGEFNELIEQIPPTREFRKPKLP
jgi:3',5'-cyclic AMP phosphodiesterase CpdA